MAKNKPENETLPAAVALAAEVANDELDFLDAQIFIEDRKFGPQYPIVQWQNGSPQRKSEGGMAYYGGFFVATEQGLDLPGAEPVVYVTREGDEIKGSYVRDLELSILRIRKVWVVGRDREAQRFANEEYDMATELAGEKPPVGHTQILCRARGANGVWSDAFVFTCKGNTAKAMTGNTGKQRGVIPTFGQTIVNGASRLAAKAGKPKDFPLCAFIAKVGPDRKEDGTPEFTTVGSEDVGGTSITTLPAWLDKPGDANEGEIKRRFVSKTVLTENQMLHQGSADWEKAWSLEVITEQRAKRAKIGAGALAAESTNGVPAGAPKANHTPLF